MYLNKKWKSRQKSIEVIEIETIKPIQEQDQVAKALSITRKDYSKNNIASNIITASIKSI